MVLVRPTIAESGPYRPKSIRIVYRVQQLARRLTVDVTASRQLFRPTPSLPSHVRYRHAPHASWSLATVISVSEREHSESGHVNDERVMTSLDPQQPRADHFERLRSLSTDRSCKEIHPSGNSC